MKIIRNTNNQEKHQLFSKSITLPGYGDLKGFKFDFVGFKRNVKLGETAYMVAEISNKTSYQCKGKANLKYITPYTDEIKCFDRKFHIDSQNYAKISEDVTLLESFGRMKFWIHTLIKIKIGKIKIQLEGLSPEYPSQNLENKIFYIELRASVFEDAVYFNDTIPIGIDTRFHTHNIYRKVRCDIIENYENVEQKVVHSFKIKDIEATHSSFHWKVPSRYGMTSLTTHLYMDDNPILPKNIDVEPLSFELKPRPKK